MERAGSLDPKAEEFYPSFSFALAAQPMVPPQFYIQYQQAPAPAAAAAVPGQYVMTGQMVEEEEGRRGVEVSFVPRGVSVEMVRVAMEEFGGVRAVEMGGVGEEGKVIVHFYDLRSAQAAVVEIREQHVRQQLRLGQQYGVVPGGWGAAAATVEQAGVVYWMYGGGGGMSGGRGLIGGQAVWANFTDKELDGPNQGSLCILNAGGQGLSLDAIRQVFESFGGVKEVREVAHGQQQKKVVLVVEFFDTRDAARALSELRDKQVLGMQLMIEFNKPKSSGQQKRRSGVQQNLPLPPRLMGKTSNTNTGQSQRWSQIKGGRGGVADGGESMGLIKRTSITTNSISGGIRRGKNNNNNNSSSSSSSSSSFKQQQRWKNHNHGIIKSEVSMFLFKEDVDTKESSSSSSSSSPSCRDSRTTVMIKNIPNKYSQKLLLNMLDSHCIHCNEQSGSGGGEEPISAYDFVYLPIDFNNKCNVGYGFVNLTSPEAAWRLYKAFHMQPWEVFNSRKICQVTYARLQGLEALKDHFKNSKFACDDDEYMPVFFSPPRDGKQLTEPSPIGSRNSTSIARLRSTTTTTTTTTTSTKASSSAEDDDDDGDDDDEECPDSNSSMLSEALLNLTTISQE
ncbi:Protein Mei2 essential for commitment to meiosis and related proteins protein [Dioscorea alata]|uniref:Protein Mei2 essential for commitment to meiosis and related proteins protein n=1 Tax=Dioscorea alata TaxID=55571 RepID=A0ACB7WAD7_DIOAL|nr:Protein Mei2 essential for commitment to meiosis and related proteins protein [Dioscorea alata]